MALSSLSSLSDHEVLVRTAHVAGCERRTTADLVAPLAEVDSRRLYLGEGYSSLFTYCTQALHFSESAAYGRITAARAARRHPLLLVQLATHDITLTTVSLLAAHLTDENLEQLLDAARHKSKRDIEELVAGLHAQPPVPSSLRRVPHTASALALPCVTGTPSAAVTAEHVPERCVPPAEVTTRPGAGPTQVVQSMRAAVAPLGSDRYLLKITLTGEAHRQLERARDLLRHAVPNGDPATIVERALRVLVRDLERSKRAVTSRPRLVKGSSRPKLSGRRHIPAAIRRAVWERDDSRCAFVGSNGRCAETGFLELHHVQPFARGGPATVDNLQLRCRAHNQHEAALYFADN